MDIQKLYEKVMNSEEVQDIPVIYVFTVLTCVLEAISSGDCFYDTE